jgi:hypothetical protein
MLHDLWRMLSYTLSLAGVDPAAAARERLNRAVVTPAVEEDGVE